MASIYDWSTTAASNASVGSINWAEGQAPSSINDSARAEMADVAKWRDMLGGAKISSGTDTIALTSGLSISSYAQGMMFAFEAGGANTGAATLNVDSVAAKDIKKFHDVALASGDIEAGGIYLVAYEATADNFQLLSAVSNAPLADPMTTRGDIMARNTSNVTARLAVGSANTVLKSDGTDVSFGSVATGMIDDNAVSLSKMAGLARGKLIYGDASGDPAALAVGAANEVLTHDGTDFDWAAAGGGAWTLLTSTVISADATVTFTGLGNTYDSHVFVISDLVSATDDKGLFMVVGDAGGLDTGASDYRWTGNTRGSAAGSPDASAGDGGNPEIDLCLGQGASGVGIGNAAGESYNGIVYLLTPTDGTSYPTFRSSSAHHGPTQGVVWTSMAAYRLSVITLTQVQFKLESDATMTSGRISLFGIKHT